MKRTKITSAIVAVALGVACIASVTAEKFRTTEYGRIVVASVLYDEPATQVRYEKLSYDYVQIKKNGGDPSILAKSENAQPDNEKKAVLDESIPQDRNKAALMALTDTDRTRRELAEQRQREYKINTISQIQPDTSTSSVVLSPLPSGTTMLTTAPTPAVDNGNLQYLGQYLITGYCPCVLCCDKNDGITACGKLATSNHTIAAPPNFAFGTKLVFNGYEYVVEDRGGAIQGNHIDLYFDTHQEALNWGRQYFDVWMVSE